VIAVFVRHQDRGQIGKIFAYGGQPFRDFTAAQAGVDQNARPLCRDESRVSRATAG
jgi:hypothetical protein